MHRCLSRVVDEAQCLYVADCANNRIRRVCLRTRETITVAGSGVRGHTDGHARAASFFRPSGIAVSCDHSVYVTEFSNVRQMTHAGMRPAASTSSNRFMNSLNKAADNDKLELDQVGHLLSEFINANLSRKIFFNSQTI